MDNKEAYRIISTTEKVKKIDELIDSLDSIEGNLLKTFGSLGSTFIEDSFFRKNPDSLKINVGEVFKAIIEKCNIERERHIRSCRR